MFSGPSLAGVCSQGPETSRTQASLFSIQVGSTGVLTQLREVPFLETAPNPFAHLRISRRLENKRAHRVVSGHACWFSV